MSGFELEHRSVSDKFERNQQAFKSSKDDSNRALLESLKRSANIAQDLASLYSERPYVYARVMKQLSGVLGAARVRRLHTTVQDNARRMAEVQRAEAEKAAKKSLHKKSAAASNGSASAAKTADTASVENGGKDYNIQFLGVSTKVKLSSENGTHAIECSEWNIPYLKSLRGSASITNAELSDIKLDATLEAKHLKSTQVHFELQKINGRFEPSGSFSTAVEIPGLDDLNVAFKFVKEGETTKLDGSFETDATLFKSVKVGASGKVALDQGNTSFEGTLSAKGSAALKDGGAQKGGQDAAKKSDGPDAAPSAASAGTKLNMSGKVNLSVTDGKFDAVSGEITATGLGFVADPSSSVTLSVRHTGEDFEAKMSKCALKPYTVPGTQATLSLTVQEASYSSANQFSAKAHVGAKLLDAVTAEGDVEFVNNKLQAATLTVQADNFSIPAKNAGAKGGEGGAANTKGGASILGGSLNGTLGIVDGAFEKANVTGSIHLTVAQKTIGVNLDTIDIDAQGAVKGSVSLAQPFALGCATIMSCQADFDSAKEGGLTKVDGAVKIDHPNLKSEEPGLSFNYAEGTLQASGAVKVLQKDGPEIATSQLTMKLSAETLSATCDVKIDNDFPIPDAQSKFKILKGATAKLEIVDNAVQPLKFSGNYKYGDAQEGGQADTKSAGAGGFAFSGSVQDGVYDLNTGAFDGTVSAVLESDVSISGGCATLTLPQKRYEAKNQLTVTFADSKPMTAAGQLTGEVDLALKSGKDGNLRSYVTAKIENFDFEKGEFTGKIMAKLIENYELYNGPDGTKIVLQGRRECGLNLMVAANTITDMDLDAASKVTVPNENVTQKKVVFDADFKNVKLDLNTLALLNANAAATLDGDVELNAHNGDTHVTVKDKSSVTLDVKDGEVTSFKVNTEYEGNTKALRTQTPIIFKGSAGVDIKKKGEGYDLNGQTEVEMTEDCILDAIEGMDKITLEKKTRFGLEFSEKGLQKVTGDFFLDYDYVEANKYIPNGFGAKLTGTNIVCEIGEKEKTNVSGKFKLAPNKNIDIVLASDNEAAKVEFSLLKSGSGIEAELKNSKLKKLGGTTAFTAKAALNGTENNAELAIDKGNAKFGFDVETGDLENLTVTADVHLKADLIGGMVSINAEKMHATANFDKNGITSSSFNGKADIDIKRKSGDPLHMELSGDLKYAREKSFDGKIDLTCKSETKLGDFEHKNKKFEYGLGQAKGPAAFVKAEIASGKVSMIEGDIGLFLRQTGKDDLGLLKVHGDVNFKYDCEKNTLLRASGKVSIEEKTLFRSEGDSKESLVLKPSEATVTFENDKFVGVSGSVNLALADKDGDYLLFTTKGDFDCLDEKKFTGKVSASFVRDKELGKPTSEGYQFVMAKGGGFECDIEENKIGALSGSFNFKVQKEKENLFAGSVQGSYTPAKEGDTESKLNATGEISLLKDMNIDKEGKFKLGAGSKGSATIVNNALQTIHGELIVIIDGPKTEDGQSKSKIQVKSQGTIDLTKGMVTEFSGEAELVGESFEISKGLSVTKLEAGVSIQNNELKKINGRAGIKYENKGFQVTGDAALDWEKIPNGEDKIGFNGELSVTAFEGKLSGKVGVDYKSWVNGGAPVITGKLFFKITDWLGGEIGVRFEKGWEDPVVDGSIKVTDVELLAARKLFGFGKDLGAEFPVFTGVTAGVGIGVGLSLDMEAIKFGGTIEINNYHVKSPKGIPDFKTSLNCTTGLALKAGIKPYVSVGVGVPMLSAGIKIKGGAEFKTTASAGINGELRGGEKGLGGEFGLGVEVKGEFAVTVTPSFYANAFGAQFNKDIHTWEFNLGELFNFTWGKKIVWDQSGTRLEDGAKTVPMTPTKTETASEANKESITNSISAFKSGGKPAKAKEGAPKLPDAETLGNQVLGKTPDKPEEAGKGFGEKLEQAKKIAKALESIGKMVSMISGAITSASVAGPLGPIVYIAIKVIKGELNIDTFKALAEDVRDGIGAIKELLADIDLLKLILPEWAYKIYDFLRNNNFNMIKKKVLDTLKEKFNEKGSPLSEILQPVLGFVENRMDAIGDILMLFTKGDVASIVKGIFKILGFAFSSIGEIVKMTGKMLSILGALVKVNIKNGNIYVQCIEHGFFELNEYWWQFCIPGLCNWSGSSEKDGGKKTSLLCNGLLLAFGGYGLQKTPRKSSKEPPKKGSKEPTKKGSKETSKKEK